MAFCGNCGNQLQSDERFCVKCGHDVSANAAPAAAPVAASAAPPMQPMAAAPPVQAAAPAWQPAAVQYAAPGAIPVAMAVPQAPQKRGGVVGTVIVIALVAAGFYYYSKHRTPPTPPVTTAQLSQQQNFAGHWENVFGFIEVSNGKWTNNAKLAIQTATLECDQYSSNNTDLAQMRTTLNGPVQPGAAATFDTFQMGTVADYMNHVNCWIVDVSPATTAPAAK
jgi:hypothetical protein